MNSESSDLCTYAQKDYIAMINDRACKFLNAALECDLLDKPFDRREANSWIEYLHLRRRLECLRAMDLNAGDLVQKFDDDETAIEEVVSISNEGRVYFKGGLVVRRNHRIPYWLVCAMMLDARGDQHRSECRRP